MKDESVVIIFEKPSLYFFSHYRDIVCAPFCSERKGIWYLVYKALYLTGSPLCQVFWGKWKQKVKKAKLAVIFDYGYQRGMETYIKQINPDCQVYLFCWNKVNKVHCSYKNFRFPEHIFSTDPGDCRRYGFRYNHMFYPRVVKQCKGEDNRLFFVGADKGRAGYLSAIGRLMKSSGIACDIRILRDKKTGKNLSEADVTVMNHPMEYAEYLKNLKHSGVLLEIVQTGQTALTMRTLEAMFFSKKLITNNTEIVKYDFYCENNIFVLSPDLETVTGEEIHNFLKKPFLPYPEETLESYGFEHWKNGFCEVSHVKERQDYEWFQN